MREFVTDAIVLDRVPQREHDELFTLYTRDMGLVQAKAVSSRKGYSKFSAHLDPFSEVSVRLVGEHGLIIADAVSRSRYPALRASRKALVSAMKIASFMREFFPEEAPDGGVWEFLRESFGAGRGDAREFLALTGYDARHAVCASCKKTPVTAFLMDDHSFRCVSCSSKIPETRLLYID
jgi:recombinational DNA repair protein (RecF pathway)